MTPKPHWQSTAAAHKLTIITPLYAEGYSATEIALEFTGATRNMVIGVISRAHLPARETKYSAARNQSPALPRHRAKTEKLIRKMSQPHVEPVLRPLPETPPRDPPNMLNLELIQLTDHTCKWPIGDPRHADFAFCGLAVKPDSPYCPAHYRRAYTGIIRAK